MKTWPYIRTVIFILAGIYISFLGSYDVQDWEFYLGLGVIVIGLLEGYRLIRRKPTGKNNPSDSAES